MNNQWAGKSSYSELKTTVADAVRAFLADLQGKIAGVDDSAVQQKLKIDEAAMEKVADETLHRVQTAVGLRPNAQ